MCGPVGSGQLEIMKKNFGKVEVKRVNPELDEIPEDCGYNKRFKYDVDMHSNGIMGGCIEWCQIHCKSKWGWWFKNDNSWYQQWDHEHNEAFMSFNSGREAFRFWFQVGCKHYGDNDPDEH